MKDHPILFSGPMVRAVAAAVAADPRHVRIATIKLLCDCEAGADHPAKGYRGADRPLGVCDYVPSPLGPPVYMCPGCRRFWPWCQGAASEDNPEFCDDCWADAREGATAP